MFLNKIKTFILLSMLSGLFMLIGLKFGGAFGLYVSMAIALIMNFTAYFYSDKIVLRMYDAKPMDQYQFSRIYSMVEDLTDKMDLPMPKIWLIDTPMANAFATGRNPENASIALTTGILHILDEREVRAVLSHEISHIKNRDILITTIAASLATAIGYLANILRYGALWNTSSDNNKKSNPLTLLMIAIIMPVAATLIQLALSRSREYLADETGADCCKDPLALASALEKLQYNIKFAHLNNHDTVRAATGSLFIVHPFTSVDWMALFSTHPPMQKRIARLKQMSEELHNQ